MAKVGYRKIKKAFKVEYGSSGIFKKENMY